MRGDDLVGTARFEVPETEASVVAGGDEFGGRGGEGEGGEGVGMGDHGEGVCT